MKKFFIALTIFFCVAGNIAEAVTKFTDKQIEQIISSTEQNPATVSLNLDVDTFKKNFNAFINDFSKKANNEDQAAKFKEIFLIGGSNFYVKGTTTLFVKNFFDGAMIVGSVDKSNKFKVLNLFVTLPEERDKNSVQVLLIRAFLMGILPEENDAKALFEAAKKNPNLTRDGVKYSFSTADNLIIVSVVAE